MIRITGGKFKKKKLTSITNFVRPTSSLKRQAFFSIIESYAAKNSLDLYENKIFLDLFAGIGTMGLEAISRGMNEVIFFENNNSVIKVLKQNCLAICKNNEFTIYVEDIINTDLEIKFKSISAIYIDPPYEKYNLTKLLKNIVNKISKNTLIGLELSKKDKVKLPEDIYVFKKKTYARTIIYFFKLA